MTNVAAQNRQNFFAGSLKLSGAAKQVLARLDESIELYVSRRGERPEHMYLYKHNFKSLNTSLRSVTKGKLSLENSNYRGVRLLDESG